MNKGVATVIGGGMHETSVACGVALVIAIVAAAPIVSAQLSQQQGSAVYGVTPPDGYRDWKLITVAHEAGMNNDIRAILGNEVALRGFREGTRP